MIFVEMPWFTRRLRSRLDDSGFRDLQNALLTNPDLGDVMPGCGGLRKLRWANAVRGQGRRGGVRVIYLSIPQVSRVLLIDIYGKNEKDDLTPQDRKVFAELARRLRAAALSARLRSGGGM